MTYREQIQGLARNLRSVLEKSRDSFSLIDIKTLEETIALLENLNRVDNHYDSRFFILLRLIIQNLFRVFLLDDLYDKIKDVL